MARFYTAGGTFATNDKRTVRKGVGKTIECKAQGKSNLPFLTQISHSSTILFGTRHSTGFPLQSGIPYPENYLYPRLS